MATKVTPENRLKIANINIRVYIDRIKKLLDDPMTRENLLKLQEYTDAMARHVTERDILQTVIEEQEDEN